MKNATLRRAVRVELELRVTYRDEPGRLAEILRILREAGGTLAAHMVYRIDETSVGLFVCANPTEAALALQKEGVTMETESVVLVETENRPGALSHLIATLESEKIGIAYSYATAKGEDLLVVFCTDNNPKSEDVLRNYLLLGRQEGGQGPLPDVPAEPPSSPSSSAGGGAAGPPGGLTRG